MKFPDNYQGLDFQGAHYTVIDTVYKRKHHNTLQRFVGLFFFPPESDALVPEHPFHTNNFS